MNTNQINDLKARISNIEQLDIDSMVSEIFKDQDIENLLIGQYKVPEFVSTLKRLLKQFKIEFEENGHFLPFQYNYQNEFGSGNLQSDFQNLASQLGGKAQSNLNSSVAFINRLVYYQIANGFWDKSVRKYHKASEIKITELKDQLNLISRQLGKYGDNYRLMVDELNKKKEEIQNLINQKNKELQQITNNLQTSNSNSNQITQLLTNSTSTNEKINGLLNQQTQNLENQKKKSETQDTYFEKQTQTFKNIEVTLEKRILEVETQIKSFNEKLEFVEGKKNILKREITI